MKPSLEHPPTHPFIRCASTPESLRAPLCETWALSWPGDPLGVWIPKLTGPTELGSSPGTEGLSEAPKAPHSTYRSPDGRKLHHGSACLLTGKYQVEHLSIL